MIVLKGACLFISTTYLIFIFVFYLPGVHSPENAILFTLEYFLFHSFIENYVNTILI